jgi:hypothetical protein
MKNKTKLGILSLAGLIAVGTIAGIRKEKEVQRETVWFAPETNTDRFGNYGSRRETYIAEFMDIAGRRVKLGIIESRSLHRDGGRWIVSGVPCDSRKPRELHLMLNRFPDLVKAYQKYESHGKIIAERIWECDELVGLRFRNYETDEVYGEYLVE